MRSLQILASIIVGLAVLITGVTVVSAADSITVKLAPKSGSGESGTATLTKSGDKQTKVTLNVEGAPAAAQPVHIHKGTCAELDEKPLYPLSPVINGKSETMVNVSLDDLTRGFAINGHKSQQDVKTYVFCGDIAQQ